MGVNQMTGVPWHLETLKSNDARRHKSNCGYYDSGYCKFYIENCRGSAHCDAYNENIECADATTNKPSNKSKKHSKVHKGNHKTPALKEAYKVGSKVTNIYFVDDKPRYKTGIIVDVDPNKYIVVEFTSKKGSHYNETFRYPDCLRYLKPYKD